jgi:hypothetical protein
MKFAVAAVATLAIAQAEAGGYLGHYGGQWYVTEDFPSSGLIKETVCRL